MSRRTIDERETRKLSRRGASYSVTLPIEHIRALGWRTKQKVVIKRHGAALIIRDWKKK